MITGVSNIAEGKGRRSPREYRSFLINARGSAFELDAQILIARDLAYVGSELADELSERIGEIARMLNAIVRYLSDR